MPCKKALELWARCYLWRFAVLASRDALTFETLSSKLELMMICTVLVLREISTQRLNE